MRAWFLIHPDGLVLRRDGDDVELPTDDDARALGVSAEGPETHAIGKLGDADAFAAPLARDVALPAPLVPIGPFDLRKVYPSLGKERFTLAGTANQIVHWAQTHRYCGRCATPTVREPNERAMRCPNCKLLAYPRISPAVIVLVRRGDEALLARGANFPLPMYSTLAGFVEVGESLEETIAREIREEVGVEVKDMKYFGSQPWPFPHSLMLAFTAEWAGGEIAADPKEIVDAQWFTADALPMVSPPLSIARWMIDAWVAEVSAKR